MKSKLFDCVTFFQENLQMELRFNILNDIVDKFIVCESFMIIEDVKKKLIFQRINFLK